MSRKSAFLAGLIAIVGRLGGAHLTREARERTMQKFAAIMFGLGYTHFLHVRDITGKHLRVYVEERKGQTNCARTLQNEMAHLRTVIEAGGNRSICKAPELSNRALGISGGSRKGTNCALSDEELARVIARATKLRRDGMARLLCLERCLGLRGNEAIHARLDTLLRWQREMKHNQRIEILEGTKGGGKRFVHIKYIVRAMAAIDEAIPVAQAQRGFLVVRANGKPAGGLKQARSIYHSWMNRARVKPHAGRYAFIGDQVQASEANQVSKREALISASQDAGHGSGRGRWVTSVYLTPRAITKPAEITKA